MDTPDVETLTNTLVATANVLLREAGRLFKQTGITAAQFNVLNLLAGAKAGLRPSDLTESLVVDPSSTTYLLDQMEKRGWVRRLHDVEDRRGYRVVIAGPGLRVHRRAAALYRDTLEELGRGLTATEARGMTDALLQMKAAAPAAVDLVLAPVASPQRRNPRRQGRLYT